MAASYPNSIKTWTPVVSGIGNLILPAHVNDLYDEVIAMETKLLSNPFKVYHGILSRSQTTNPLPTHITTTTFTLSCATYPLTYYHQGIPLLINTNLTCTLNDGAGGSTAGIYYVYFNNGYSTISATKTFPGLTSMSDVLIAGVCWNGSNYGLINDERHSYERSLVWHQWAHMTIGCRYKNGIILTHNSGTGAAATFATTLGEIWDEDIIFTVNASSNFPTANACRLCYQNSASTYTYDNTTSTVPFKRGANNRPVYVDNNYNVVEMSTANNRYINVFVYVTTDLHTPIHMFTETVSADVAAANGHASLTAARAIGFPNLSAIALSPEYKAIYRLIVRADGALQAIDTTLDDYRLVSSVPTSAGTSSINASSVIFTPYGELTSASVQGALEQVNNKMVATYRTWSGTTSDAVATEIFLNSVTNNRFTLSVNSAIAYKMVVIAYNSTGGVGKHWEIEGSIKRGANTVTQMIARIGSAIFEDTGTTAWALDITGDDTNKSLKIAVTGATSTTIKWSATAMITTVQF